MSQWQMQDMVTSATYTFKYNPDSMDPPVNPKRLETMPHFSSPRTWKPRTVPREYTFSGVVYDEDTLLEFTDWFGRKHELQITDHLGRVFRILPTGVEFRERRSRKHPWKHVYTVRGFLTRQLGGGIG